MNTNYTINVVHAINPMLGIRCTEGLKISHNSVREIALIKMGNLGVATLISVDLCRVIKVIDEKMSIFPTLIYSDVICVYLK